MSGPVTFGRKRPLPPCSNPLFLKWLTEWRDSTAEKGLKTQYVYQKAISSLKKYPLPLRNGKEAKILQNFGDGICKMLDERLEKYYAEHDEKFPPVTLSSQRVDALAVPVKNSENLDEDNTGELAKHGSVLHRSKVAEMISDFEDQGPNAPIHSLPSLGNTERNQQRGPSPLSIQSAQEESQGPSPVKIKKTDGKKQREYVPQRRSGGYAVLLTLYKDSKNPNSKGYMTKAELQRDAQSLCDKSFTLTDPSNKYTAWSSVSTLIQKDLVIKTHVPARYSLTEKGLELAQRLEAAEQGLQDKNDRTRQVDAISPEGVLEDTSTMDCRQSIPNTLVPPYKTLSLSSASTYSIMVSSKQPSEDPTTICHNHVPDFSLLPGDFNVLLCVDFIETTGGAAHRKQELVSELKRNGVTFDVRKLHIGDFLWVAQEKVKPVPGQLRIPQARELVLDYVIERKRMDDLCGSIIDGRFREQKFRLKRCGLHHPIYLVENYGSAQHLSIPETTLQQAIVNTQVIDGFFVKRTKDVRESAAYLTIMTRYLQNMYSNKTLLSCTKEEAGKCEGVLRHDAQSCILMEFKEFNEGAMKNKAQTVKEVFARQLMQISGVSGEKATAVLERYNTPASLLSAYECCSTTEEREKLLSNVKCGKLQRNLGPVLSKTVSQLYCTKEALS